MHGGQVVAAMHFGVASPLTRRAPQLRRSANVAESVGRQVPGILCLQLSAAIHNSHSVYVDFPTVFMVSDERGLVRGYRRCRLLDSPPMRSGGRNAGRATNRSSPGGRKRRPVDPGRGVASSRDVEGRRFPSPNEPEANACHLQGATQICGLSRGHNGRNSLAKAGGLQAIRQAVFDPEGMLRNAQRPRKCGFGTGKVAPGLSRSIT